MSPFVSSGPTTIRVQRIDPSREAAEQMARSVDDARLADRIRRQAPPAPPINTFEATDVTLVVRPKADDAPVEFRAPVAVSAEFDMGQISWAVMATRCSGGASRRGRGSTEGRPPIPGCGWGGRREAMHQKSPALG